MAAAVRIASLGWHIERVVRGARLPTTTSHRS